MMKSLIRLMKSLIRLTKGLRRLIKHLQLYILYNLDVAQDEAAQYIAQLEMDKRNYFIADLERSSPARIKIWVWERYQITDKGCFVFRLKELIYTVLKIIHKN